MKNCGIVRKIDDLGRIVIPKELRKTLSLEIGDGIEIYTEGEMVLLKKYAPACVFCGEARGVSHYKGKNICLKCMQDLKR